MSTATNPSVQSPASPDRSPFISWLAVISVMLGIFSIVTTEILPIGLLTSIGSSFTISDGMAGLMMTMPGFLAAVSAPVVTVATGRIDRRVMLGVFVLLLSLANFLAAKTKWSAGAVGQYAINDQFALNIRAEHIWMGLGQTTAGAPQFDIRGWALSFGGKATF